jgi:hypothetical protein
MLSTVLPRLVVAEVAQDECGGDDDQINDN